MDDSLMTKLFLRSQRDDAARRTSLIRSGFPHRQVARGRLSSARPSSTTFLMREPLLTHAGGEADVIGQGGPPRAPRVDGGSRFLLRRRELMRKAAFKETRVPPVQLPFSPVFAPLLEIPIPGMFCPLVEPLRALTSETLSPTLC